jgi:hypothetical protein
LEVTFDSSAVAVRYGVLCNLVESEGARR